jgi:hypothetical protein
LFGIDLILVITNRELSDFDKQGKLAKEQFILALYLIKEKMGGKELPTKLSIEYIPMKFRRKHAPVKSRNSSEVESIIPAAAQATINGMILNIYASFP